MITIDKNEIENCVTICKCGNRAIVKWGFKLIVNGDGFFNREHADYFCLECDSKHTDNFNNMYYPTFSNKIMTKFGCNDYAI